MTIRALAIHPGALGDVVLAVPALRAFAAGEPLTLVAQPHVGALLVALGVAREAVDVDASGLDALFVDDPGCRPRLPQADRVVSWFGSRDAVFVRRLRALAPDVIVAPSTGAAPIWHHLLDSVAAPAGDWRAPIAVPVAVQRSGEALLRESRWNGAGPLVIAHVGASGPAKRWAPAAFAAVLNDAARAVTVALHAGPQDEDAVAAVTARLRVPALVLRRPRLADLAGALTHAVAFVGNDSGISHLAAAVGAKSVIVHAERNGAWVSWSPSAVTLPVTFGGARADDVARVGAALAAALRARRLA